MHTPMTDHEEEEEKEKKSRTEHEVKLSLERSASLVDEMSREENVLRARLQKMGVERDGLYKQVARWNFI